MSRILLISVLSYAVIANGYSLPIPSFSPVEGQASIITEKQSGGASRFPENHEKHSIIVTAIVFAGCYGYAINEGYDGQERLLFASADAGFTYLL